VGPRAILDAVVRRKISIRRRESNPGTLELCGGAVTVSSSKYLPWQAMHFYNAPPTSRNVLQTVDHFEMSCLGAPFSWLEKPRNRMGRDLD
jgi:hypothetical protein